MKRMMLSLVMIQFLCASCSSQTVVNDTERGTSPPAELPPAWTDTRAPIKTATQTLLPQTPVVTSTMRATLIPLAHYITGTPEYKTPPFFENETIGWKIYRNEEHGFELMYPGNAEIQEDFNLVEIDLPFSPGTQLECKYFAVYVREGSRSGCFAKTIWHGVAYVNDIEFLYIPGSKWENTMGGLAFFASDYQTYRDGKCYILLSRLGVRESSGFTGNTPLPYPPGEELDTDVFMQILSSFRFVD